MVLVSRSVRRIRTKTTELGEQVKEEGQTTQEDEIACHANQVVCVGRGSEKALRQSIISMRTWWRKALGCMPSLKRQTRRRGAEAWVKNSCVSRDFEP